MNQQQTYWPVADQRFPWLTRDQISRIEQVTANYTGINKLKAQQQLYQQAINQIKNQQVTEERFWAKNEMYSRSLDKDTKQKNTDQSSIRLEDLADIVKNKYNLNANTDTNTVIDWVVRMAQDKNVDINLLNKYLDSWDKEFLYDMGFEEKPEEKIDYLGLASAYFNPVWYIANKAWEYFWEHPAEISVWAAQSPWKRWYNLIGQWIDRAWKALAWKLEWTELADTVRQAAIDMFWEEEVKNYAMQKQQELNNWTAFNGREATDIRTPLLWDKANSQATQVWETIWDIWTAIALSYPMATSLAPYMWINTATQAWRTLLLWATQWAADMAAYEYWANQEIASPTELWVWALIWAWTPFVVPMSSAIWKWVSNKYNDIIWAFKTASKEKLWEELRNLFSKGIKPSSAWIKTTSAQEKIYDDAMDAVETIINNKNNLKFTNANWEEIVWKLPTNTREFAQAIQQTKQDIYNQYNAIAQTAWKDTRVNVDELVDELLKLKNDKAALLWNEWLETSIDNWLRWLSEIKDLSVEQAQKKIQEINQKLDAFYKNPNPNDVSKSSVDALVKNKLAESLDNSIESALWTSSEYDSLKRAYSALKTIEKDVNHRAIVSWRQSPNSLVDSIADISSVESLLDVLSWSPVWAVKAIWKQALKKYIKWLNSSDNMVQKLFSKAEWELERSWTLKTNQQILRQQEREYQKWLSQWSNKNYLPYKEWVDDAWKTVIPWGERIAVTPEWNAVREWQINEVNTQKSLENGKNSEYNYNDLNSNQIHNDYNWTQWTREAEYWSNWWRDQGILEDSSMTNWGTSKGWNWTSQQLVRITDWDEMVKLSSDLQSRSSRWLFMDVHDADHYNKSINIVSPNKDAAIIVTPEKVWKNIWNFIKADDAPKWIGKDLMMQAIEEWWNKMDNFWRFLTKYYENFWFKPVARVKFNREYAPKGWNYARDWEPDLFVMMHNWDSPEAVKANYWTYKHMTDDELKSLPEMDYDTALTYRDNKIKLSQHPQNELKSSEDVLKYAEDNKDTILELYKAEKWNYVNPDDFRDFINDNQRLLASETQDWASWLAEQYFNQLLKENKNGKGLIIAWWPWGWKWTSLKELWKRWEIDTEWANIIVDKTKGTKELKKMKDNWMSIEWDIVVPDANWIVNNIIWRTISQNKKLWLWKWRTLPINWYWIPTHKEVAQIAKDLYNDSKNSKDFIVRFIDNTWKKEDINIKDWVEWIKLIEEFQWKLENITEWSVKKSVDEAYKKWDITKKQRDDMIKSITSILFVWWLLYWANEES